MAALRLAPPRGRALTGAVVYGALNFGGVFAFAYYVRHWAASRAAFMFVVIPVVTILLSAWLDDEPIRTGLILGGVLVVAGVYVGALRGSTAAGA